MSFQMRCVLPVLLLMPLAAHAEALSVLDQCIAVLDDARDVGIARVAARCPALVAALSALPNAAALPVSWREPNNDLSRRGLITLRELLRRERAAALLVTATARAPSLEVLRGVLDELGDTAQKPTGLWTRLNSWLRSLFDKQKPGARKRSALDRWLDKTLSSRVRDVIGYTLLALCALFAVWSIAQELRVAGWFDRRLKVAGGADAEAGEAHALTLTDVGRAPLAERPGLLLRMIAAAFERSGILVPAVSRSASELGTAPLRDASYRGALLTVSRVAEQARFGVNIPDAPQLLEGEQAGRAVLDALPVATAESDAARQWAR